ncbi:MAG TPA: c-type cytochrome, partial [Gemmata sp.]|nr:c-type cytochrome [Gemmata sp.]
MLLASTTSPAVEPSELKPGLVATYQDAAVGGDPARVARLEPTVAVRLAKGESPHPRLRSLSRATWSGYINVTRPGSYQFDAAVNDGRVEVKVGGKVMLTGAAGSPSSAAQLAGGVQSFEVTFDAAGSSPRLELGWKGPGFVREPLPHQFLGHLPKDRPAALAGDLELEHGRFLFEELACAKCHQPAAGDRMAKGLAERAGPNLTEVGKRAYPGWIDSWLADPAKHRPHTAMPKMFSDDDRGRAERYAVTKYLDSLAGLELAPYRPPFVASNEYKQSFERGRVLYHVTGCAACHEPAKGPAKPKGEEDDREPLKADDYLFGLGTAGPTARYHLGALGSKTRPEPLAAYLRDPLKTNPAGRMPDMKLNQQEANDLARYLCREVDEVTEPGMPVPPKTSPTDLAKYTYRDYHGVKAAAELRGFAKLPAERQWTELGARLVVLRGCVECHAVEPGGKPLAPAEFSPSLDEVRRKPAAGCLAPRPDAAKVPVYKLDAKQAAALTAFLKTGLDGAGSPAPTHAARAALRRFNCLNCHSRDGEGGIPTELADQMRLLEKAENADDVRPPLLTGVGHKSRTSWLKSVLTGGGRARPWMQLRMPQYGDANVGFLPEALAAVEGATPDDSVHTVPLSNQQIALGRQIIGKAGLGCISCHD